MHDYTKLGYAVILTDDAIRYTLKKNVVDNIDKLDISATHVKDYTDKLCTVTPATHTDNDNIPTANNVIHHEINANYVGWMHATLGSPPISSLIKAIHRGALRNIPRLTTKIVRQNPPHTRATAMGHLDNTRANQRSTNPAKATNKQNNDAIINQTSVTDANENEDGDTLPGSLNAEENEDEFEEEPPHDHIAMKIYYDDPAIYTNTDEHLDCYTRIIDLDPQNDYDEAKRSTIHTDTTGRYPIRSLKGNEYILTSVYNGYIYMQPMKSRKKEDMLAAYQLIDDHFTKRGHRPKYQRLDNETSNLLENWFKLKERTFQYCDKNNHRRNFAERAIRDAKNHIIATMATAHKDCPKTLWDESIPQCNITLNILRRWKPNPNISAYEGFHGQMYDFDRHPIAPFGTKIAIYEGPDDRATWGDHAVDGYYLGPAKNTHRGYDVWTIGSGRKRVSHTVEWYPTPYHHPFSDATDILYMSLDNIQRQLLGLSTNTSFPNIHEGGIHDAVMPLRDLVAKMEKGTKHYPQQKRDPNKIGFNNDLHVGKDQRVLKTDGLVYVCNNNYDDQRVIPREDDNRQHCNESIEIIIPDNPIATRTRGQIKRQRQVEEETDRHERITNTSNEPIPMTVGPNETFNNMTDEHEPRYHNMKDHPNVKWIRKHKKHIRAERIQKDGDPSWEDIMTATRPMATEQQATTIRVTKLNEQQQIDTTHNNIVDTETQNVEMEDIEMQANGTVLNKTTGKPLKYGQLKKQDDAKHWKQAEHEEWHRLITKTETCRFIRPIDKPYERRPAYYNPQPEQKMKLDKLQYRIRGTVGANQGDPYLEDKAAYIADLTTVKLLLKGD